MCEGIQCSGGGAWRRSVTPASRNNDADASSLVEDDCQYHRA